MTRVTPNRITSLKENEIFVFGSNEGGEHNIGSAKTAYEYWGAVYGEGKGLRGRTYAIPTKKKRKYKGNRASLTISQIKENVMKFIDFTKKNPELTFMVTKIGCGRAQFSVEEISVLFKEAVSLSNIYLPIEFWEHLKKNNHI